MANGHDEKDPKDLLDGLYAFAFEHDDSFSMPIEEIEEDLRSEGIDPDAVDRRAREALERLLGPKVYNLRKTESAAPAQAELPLAVAETTATPAWLFGRLGEIGLPKNFVRERLLTSGMRSRLTALKAKGGAEARDLAAEIAEAVGRVYNWRPADLLGTGPLSVPTLAYGSARFKMPTKASDRKAVVYAAYAQYLAGLVLDATADLPALPIPTDAREVRSDLEARYGGVSFESALRYAWELGVPVLPLADSGAFHGACWRRRGRNVIVLKQQTRSPARWLFDFLHELRHAGEEPEAAERAVVEESETAEARRTSAEEKAASRFAGDVALAGRAEELAKACAEESRRSVERMKTTVVRVASREGVPVDVLANYLAFRLSLDCQNWWGAATNLQDFTFDPWLVSRDMVLERADLARLDAADRERLTSALGIE